MNLDDNDIKILKLLKENSLMPIDKIAKFVGLSNKKTENRIKLLENEKVIEKYYAVIDHFIKNYQAQAFSLISAEELYKPFLQLVHERVLAWGEPVQSVHVLYGEWDFLIKLVGKDFYAIDSDIQNLFFSNLGETPIATLPNTQPIRDLFDLPSINERKKLYRTGHELDEINKHILNSLQNDCRITLDQLAQSCPKKAEKSLIKKRIQKLLSDKVILGYTININAKFLIKAFVEIHSSKYEFSKILKEIKTFKTNATIPLIASGLGSFRNDIFLEVNVFTWDELNQITDDLRGMEGIRSTRTWIVADTLSGEGKRPLQF